MNSIETLRTVLRSWSALRRAATSNPQLSSLDLPGTRAFKRVGLLVVFTTMVVLFGTQFPALAQTTFTKITTGPGAPNSADTAGVAWVDFDGDGDLDLFASDDDGTNRLYRNDGNGVFTLITDGPIVNAGDGTHGATWADFDNDGRLDLFITKRESGPGVLFHQEADGTFTQKTLGLSAAFGAAWADYDNDGDMDVFVTESTFSGGGPSRLYRNDGNGVFKRIITGPLVTTTTLATGAGWGDYDNDGFLDVFVPRGGGSG